MKNVRITCLSIIVAVGLLIFSKPLISETNNALLPAFSDATYQWASQSTPNPYEYGAKIPLAAGEQFDVIMTMHVHRIRPVIWHINADDCLEKLSINGIEITHPNIPNCDRGDADRLTLYLEPYLQTGVNHVQMRLKNSRWDAGVWISPFLYDPIMLLPKFLIGLTVLTYGFWRFSSPTSKKTKNALSSKHIRL